MVRSRLSREMWSINSNPVEVIDLVLDAGGEQPFGVFFVRLALQVEVLTFTRAGRSTSSWTSGIDRQPSS